MRLLETYFNTAPRGISSFVPAEDVDKWKIIYERNFIRKYILLDPNFKEDELFFRTPFIHAGSAFYPSRFLNSVTLHDAVGECYYFSLDRGRWEN